MRDAIVVGGGIFGRVIARHLHTVGMHVELIGLERPGSGSRAAGCVIKPSWVSTMSRRDLDEGLMLLDAYYGVHGVRFRLSPSGMHTEASRVDPASILDARAPYKVIPGNVTMVREEASDHAFVAGYLAQNEDFLRETRHVVVAAGIWTPELCPWVAVDGRWGWSFRGPAVEEPTIRVWAPYRQVVALNLSDGRSWSGDGSALVERSATPHREEAARTRCMDVVRVNNPNMMFSVLGARPYAHTGGAPCLISRRGRILAVTGGAKNGTIAAAWAARRVVEEIGG